MDPQSLQELLAQLGLAPQVAAPTPPPAAPAIPMGGMQPPPFDTGVMPGTAFGTPYPYPAPEDMGGPMHVPREDPMAAPAPSGYGYMPQPRPELPTQLGDEGINPSLFSTYRGLYNPAPEDQDPIARLMGDRTSGMPGFPPPQQPQRMMPAPGRATMTSPHYGAPPPSQRPLSEAERRLLDRGPAFRRVVDRGRELQDVRARRGF